MKRVLAAGAMLAVLVVLAVPAYAADKPRSISGTITGLNMAQKTMVVRDGKGVERTVLWNEGTELVAGPLEQGASVKLKILSDEDGKLVASSIEVKSKPSSRGKPASPEQK